MPLLVEKAPHSTPFFGDEPGYVASGQQYRHAIEICSRVIITIEDCIFGRLDMTILCSRIIKSRLIVVRSHYLATDRKRLVNRRGDFDRTPP
jgi:hypothetical protein